MVPELLTTMHIHVELELIGLREGLAAHATHARLVFGVSASDVTVVSSV